MLQDLHSHLSPQRQATIYATGLTTIFTLGVLAIFSLLFAALWAVLQFAFLVCTSLIASCNELASTFSAADPAVRLILLCALVFIGYGLVRRVRRS